MRTRTLVTAALLAALSAGLALPQDEPERARPDIVFILADDLGYGDLGCYGCPDIRTPVIDGLAREGMRFTQYYTAGPVCTPTRCAFITGRYQQRISPELEWAIPPGGKERGLPTEHTSLAKLLKAAGYRTALYGKWHLGYRQDNSPGAHGFDDSFGLLSGNHDYFTHRERNGDPDLWENGKPVEVEGYTTDLITERAVRFLENPGAQPYFLYLAYNAPHWPFQDPDGKDPPRNQENWARGERATYVKMVERMDQGIGRVLEALQRGGRAKNALVFFSSDNGGDQLSRNHPLAKGKRTLWEGGIRSPLIARWPGRIPPGTTTRQMAITMDLTATILDAAGAQPPPERPLDGISLLPALAGKDPPRFRTFFWRRTDVNGRTTHQAVRDGRWKLIDELPAAGAPGKTYLHDLLSDPGETADLSSERPELVEKLRRDIASWEREVLPRS